MNFVPPINVNAFNKSLGDIISSYNKTAEENCFYQNVFTVKLKMLTNRSITLYGQNVQKIFMFNVMFLKWE